MSYEDFFRNNAIKDTVFFDEGPRVSRVSPLSTINTSSIDTLDVDPYRQGVEITQLKHFDAGIVKIHAGEPGHVLRRNRFGMDKNFRPEPGFEELDYFNPVRFLKAQIPGSPLTSNIITFPIITGDNDQIENYYYDGIIEPLFIREIASFFSIEVPFSSHDVRGAVMNGNIDSRKASDQVLTVDFFEPERMQIEYLDIVDMPDGTIATSGFFKNIKSARRPFKDERFVRNVIVSSSYLSEMTNAMNLMTGSTDNYISSKQRSATCGWSYENNAAVGTDSLAFGGMTF